MPYTLEDIENANGFDWNEGNIDKSLEKHYVTKNEIEQVLSNRPLVILPAYSGESTFTGKPECRSLALGHTFGHIVQVKDRLFTKKRFLVVVFTMRNKQIRIMSSRPGRKEQKLYEQIINTSK